MSRTLERIGLAVRRSMAKADTWVAAAAIFLAGWTAAKGSWGWTIPAGLVGLVFLAASGDYSWRKGFVAAKNTR